MKIFWERSDWPGGRVDPEVLSMSWAGNISKGWLACGSTSGAVGITLTSREDRANTEPILDRVSYNLRGHHNSIWLISWNPSQQRLASCDTAGMVYIWVPYEDRWSVELVNDRGVKVRDFRWSPSGHSALICYEDDFVLIGSTNGQRIWSNSYTEDSVTCGCWTPDSRQVVLGTKSSKLIFVSDQGLSLGHYLIAGHSPIGIRQIHMANALGRADFLSKRSNSLLSLWFDDGSFEIRRNFDDPDPVRVPTQTNYIVTLIKWSSNLNIAMIDERKFEPTSDLEADSAQNTSYRLLIYNYKGILLLCQPLPYSVPVLSLVWMHSDTAIALSFSTGRLVVGQVEETVPSLSMLGSYTAWASMPDPCEINVRELQLPKRETNMILTRNDHTIKTRVPEPDKAYDAISKASQWTWYTTIKHHSRRSQTYIMYIEHASGLVPFLIGKQTNRIVPEFEISFHPSFRARCKDPTIPVDFLSNTSDSKLDSQNSSLNFVRFNPCQRAVCDESATRQSVWRKSARRLKTLVNSGTSSSRRSPRVHPDSELKQKKLLQVVSNVWCTKFKLIGADSFCGVSCLGQVTYKTSVLHLQPRQMTVNLVNLNHNFAFCPSTPVPINDEFDYDALNSALLGSEFSQDEKSPTDADLNMDEKPLLLKVLRDFSDLQEAIDGYIKKMKLMSGASQKDAKNTTAQDGAADSLGNADALARWRKEIEGMSYIDDEGEMVGPSTSEDKSSNKATWGVENLLDKLTLLSSDIQACLEPAVFSNNGDDDKNSSPSDSGTQAQLSSAWARQDRHELCQLRQSVKVIERRIATIEKRIYRGNSILAEIKADLKKRLERIQKQVKETRELVLAQPHAESFSANEGSNECQTVVLQNKTPIWNQQSQVYQLDFGGRVTCESAKNFQIEHDHKQVMQFGRIEEGAYTLDFKSPFSPLQAFSIALASITQRMK